MTKLLDLCNANLPLENATPWIELICNAMHADSFTFLQ